MSEYYEQPSRFEPDEDRSLRIKHGIALCRSVLAETAKPALGGPTPDDGLTDPVRRARARAAEERRTRKRAGDPTPISDTFRQIRPSRKDPS